MLDHISTPDQIEKEAIEIDSFLQVSCSEDPEEAVARGNDLVVHLARSGKMLADAKWHKDKALTDSIIKNMGEQMGIPASILKQLVDASCKRENYLVNWLDRINRTCVHQIDWLRTVVSKAKEERRVTPGVNVGNSYQPPF